MECSYCIFLSLLSGDNRDENLNLADRTLRLSFGSQNRAMTSIFVWNRGQGITVDDRRISLRLSSLSGFPI